MKFFVTSHCISSSPKYSLSNLFSNTLYLCNSHNVRYQVSHPYKRTGKIVAMCLTRGNVIMRYVMNLYAHNVCIQLILVHLKGSRLDFTPSRIAFRNISFGYHGNLSSDASAVCPLNFVPLFAIPSTSTATEHSGRMYHSLLRTEVIPSWNVGLDTSYCDWGRRAFPWSVHWNSDVVL